MNTIVLNIPHATPCSDFTAWSDPDVIKAEHDKWTDWHTDTIFKDHKDRVIVHKACRSRYDVDMERLPEDPMEEQGQGIRYTSSKDGKSVRKATETHLATAKADYASYHKELKELTKAEGTLLIDCHSFPSDYAEAGNASGAEVDICIGFNDDSSRPSDELIAMVKEHFEGAGYSVGVNSPFSNSIVGTPTCPSIMIELNKKVYLNEKTHDLLPWAYKLNQVINRLYEKIFNF